MTRRNTAALACALALAGTLAACSSDTETQQEAESAVCVSLAAVKTAAADVRALSADSTISEAEAAQQALETAIADLRENAGRLNEADVKALEDARMAIQQAIADVSGSDTIGEAAASIESSRSTLDTTLAEMEDGLDCGGSTP